MTPAPLTETDSFRFYDEGWNARIEGKEFNRKATRDWKDGWKDCDELTEEMRLEIGKMD